MDEKNRIIGEQLLLISTEHKIELLRLPNVINWIMGDLSFLPPFKSINKTQDIKILKQLEDEWGRNVLKTKRPDLKLDKQWTNKFGEYICEELFTILGHNVIIPQAINNMKPDLETEDTIIEVKTQTYFTSGTAGEKILGCPFKYVDIPYLYKKKLVIFCLGGAEKVSREQYGNLPGSKCTIKKQELLNLYKTMDIEFIGATDLVERLLS